MDIGESSTIDVMIEDIGTLVHDSRLNYKMMKLRSNGILMKIWTKMPTMIPMKIAIKMPMIIPMAPPTPASTTTSLLLQSTSQPTQSPAPPMIQGPPTT
ncbi:hypothetical protein M9H77_19303 [Catharanthus roseus]|uniref:Uncharacterized protein n=1 Tax=Catharanthus roseus TaxID=4058 RepID=A0ACC0B9Y3_CATRO|nr:hypothetical protein M9H77_19303 [Catharanthus roseus]